MAYPVYTNKIGGKGSGFDGQVGYPSTEVLKALASGEDLVCYTADRPNEKMTIAHAEIRKRGWQGATNYVSKRTGKSYYLWYFRWRADGSRSLIEQWEFERLEKERLEEQNKPNVNQKTLF